MNLWLSALLVLLAGTFPLFAQMLPEAYAVSDAAQGKPVDVFSAPLESAEIIGTYNPLSANIEILELSKDGVWGKVGWNNQNGWVPMKYLQLSNHNLPDAFPRPLICTGTEPFWGVFITPQGDSYADPEDAGKDLTLLSHKAEGSGFVAVFSAEDLFTRTLTVTRATCGDGMSNRIYGWRADLLLEGDGYIGTLSGCCTMDTNAP